MLPKIRNEQEHQNALIEISDLMDLDPDPNSFAGRKLDELCDAIVEYEDDEDPYPWTMGIDEYDHLDY